jgi:hypothetical protein
MALTCVAAGWRDCLLDLLGSRSRVRVAVGALRFRPRSGQVSGDSQLAATTLACVGAALWVSHTIGSAEPRPGTRSTGILGASEDDAFEQSTRASGLAICRPVTYSGLVS